MDEDGADAEDEKAPLTVEQWKDKLNELRAEYLHARQVVRLSGEIADRMDQLAALLPMKQAERLIKQHHPNKNVVDYFDTWTTLSMEHRKKGNPAEYEWFIEAELVLTSEDLANILYPGQLENDRAGTLQLVRNLRNRIKKANEQELREEAEMNQWIEKSRARLCKSRDGNCEGCPENAQSEDDFQCGMKFAIARDPDRFSDC